MVSAVDETLEIPFSGDRDSWDSWVTEINQSLNPLNLEFSHYLDQTTGKEMYGLVGFPTLACFRDWLLTGF